MYQIQTPRKNIFCPTALAAACAAVLLGGFTTMPVLAGDNLTAALTGGKATLDMRVRYEGVNQDNARDDATALTVRTRLGYKTGNFMNVSGFLEMSNVTSLTADEDYNSKTNGNAAYSVIADPTNTIVNRAHLDYTGIPDTTLRYGQQRIIYDNTRFIGNVGWRQTEQTYTAFRFTNKSLSDTSLDYAYLSNRYTILAGNADLSAHLLNASYDGLSFGKLTGYAYLLEFPDAATSSSKTLGLRFSGATSGDFKFMYTVEYADQSDYKDGASSIDATYTRLEGGVGISGISVTVGYEMLGSNNGNYGFSTPLATLHGQNGWADQFLSTPADGLIDTTLKVAGKLAGVKLVGVYHNYSADEGSADYGSELDFLAAMKFGKNYSVGLKLASYKAGDAGTGKVDTDKLWLWAGLTF
ncbi:MAG: hypothetical protein L3J88_07930 [Gammaproteobacteria bacterium]|nr:hypothetical protein [Gammaproteobacteria bacterium]MCF6363262.1 hypothetical protein [Gammaproteobacteria bacterium]